MPRILDEGDDDHYLERMREVLEAWPNKGPPPQPSQIAPGLWIGSQKNADDHFMLQRLGITHVLNMAGSKRQDVRKSPYPKSVGIKEYMLIAAEDTEKFDIIQHIGDAMAFLGRAISGGGHALVHCNLGVNRSGTMAAAYMMVYGEQTLMQVIHYLKMKRGVILCNRGFRRQLLRFARARGFLDAYDPQRPCYPPPEDEYDPQIRDYGQLPPHRRARSSSVERPLIGGQPTDDASSLSDSVTGSETPQLSDRRRGILRRTRTVEDDDGTDSVNGSISGVSGRERRRVGFLRRTRTVEDDTQSIASTDSASSTNSQRIRNWFSRKKPEKKTPELYRKLSNTNRGNALIRDSKDDARRQRCSEIIEEEAADMKTRDDGIVSNARSPKSTTTERTSTTEEDGRKQSDNGANVKLSAGILDNPNEAEARVADRSGERDAERARERDAERARERDAERVKDKKKEPMRHIDVDSTVDSLRSSRRDYDYDVDVRNRYSRETGTRDYSERDYTTRDHAARDYGVRDYGTREYSGRSYVGRDPQSNWIRRRDNIRDFGRESTAKDFRGESVGRESVARDYSRDSAARDYSRDSAARDYSRDSVARDYGAGRESVGRDYGIRDYAGRDYGRESLSRFDSVTARSGKADSNSSRFGRYDSVSRFKRPSDYPGRYEREPISTVLSRYPAEISSEHRHAADRRGGEDRFIRETSNRVTDTYPSNRVTDTSYTPNRLTETSYTPNRLTDAFSSNRVADTYASNRVTDPYTSNRLTDATGTPKRYTGGKSDVNMAERTSGNASGDVTRQRVYQRTISATQVPDAYGGGGAAEGKLAGSGIRGLIRSSVKWWKK